MYTAARVFGKACRTAPTPDGEPEGSVRTLPSATLANRVGDVLCCSKHAEDVLAGELGQVGAGPAPVGESGEQPRIPRHVLQALGHGLRPHVVTPDADMVDAGDLTHVLDVRHDLGQRGDRRWRLLGQPRHQLVVRQIALLDPTALSLGLRLRVPPGYRG